MARALLHVVLALLVACGDDNLPQPTYVRMRVDPTGAAPSYGDAAWPTDAWRDASGKLADVPRLDAIAPLRGAELSQHLAATGGFGVRPLVEFFVEGTLDADSVPAITERIDDALVVLELDDDALERSRVLRFEWRYDAARGVVAGSPSPGLVLSGERRHAAVLSGAVRASDGSQVVAAPALSRWMSGDEAAVPARWRSTAEVARALTRSGLFQSGPRVAGLAVFTTQHATRTLARARAVLDDATRVPPPTLAFPDAALVFADAERLDALLGVALRGDDGEERWGWSNPTGIAHDHVGVLATGVMTVARFTRDDNGDRGPEGETFLVDEATGTPEVIDEAHPIPVTLVLPSTPAPPEGYPVALFGHGLGAGRHVVVTFAEPLTRRGFAVAAIDLADHGSRFRDIDEVNNLAGFIPEFSGDPSLRDGFGDQFGLGSTLALLRGFENLSAVRDSIRQSALDLCQLARLLRSKDLDLGALAGAYGGKAPRLDARRLSYLGESYGAHVGAVFAAIEPAVDLFVLDVVGGGIVDLEIADSPEIGSLLIPFARAAYGFEGRFERFHPATAVAQAVIDGGDPLTYAPHVLRDQLDVGGRTPGPRHVLVIEAIHDELIPNASTYALARAMGLEVLEPQLFAPADLPRVTSPAAGNVAGQSAVLVEYGPATHGGNWTSEVGTRRYYPGAPHPGDDPFPRLPKPFTVRNPLYETLEQVLEALVTHHAGGPPVFRSTLAPVADFDGDGVLDEDEIAMGRDPHRPGP